MVNFDYPKKAWGMVSTHYFWTYERKSMHALFYAGTHLVLATHDPLLSVRIKDIGNPGMFSSWDKTFLLNGRWYRDQLLASEDYGVTWSSNAIAEASMLDKIAFSPDGLHGMVTTTHLTLATTDGGNTWQEHSHYDNRWPKVISLCYPSPSTAYRLMSDYSNANIHYLQSSNNQGVSWTDMPLPGQKITVMHFSSATRGYLFGGDEQSGAGGFYLTTNGGGQWSWNPLPVQKIVLADVVHDTLAYIVTSDNRLFKLFTASSSLYEIMIPQGITIAGFDFSDATHGVLLGNDGWFTHVY
jgi:hypothetical protein